MIRKKALYTFVIAILACLAGCIGEEEVAEWHLRPGDALPRFEVTAIDGTKVGSADSYNASMVIVFFNTSCPDCRKELPIIQAQYEVDQSLPEAERSIFICISREEAAADVERYWAENNLTLPVSPQSDRRIYSLFASIGIPRIFYAKDGLITQALYPVE